MRGPIVVRRSGKVDRHFDTPEHAVEFLLSERGVARVYDADGGLLCTKGLGTAYTKAPVPERQSYAAK